MSGNNRKYDREAIGKAIAARLRADPKMHQKLAATLEGIHSTTYFQWLKDTDDESMAFQAHVLPAVYEQARLAEEQAERDIFGGESHSGPAVTWHRWKLEGRFRTIFGDLAQKVELSGPDGGPLQSAVTVTVAKMSDEQLRKLALGEGDDEGE